eukprot:CAMPEP_0170592414 /NCGR_PEP_ID=MMETSP0224-20130122/12911_1 /TAXON_ID=285029 /ORGANISM="Togula jolla, Strain CCCM 725" /LENGTH=54 /DNA_ID=CAMNT_0010916317 /DNA_START=793 /DNA_END=958 /DNA_ORIENTATION=+
MASDPELLEEEALMAPADLEKKHALRSDDLDEVVETTVCLRCEGAEDAAVERSK